MKRLFGAAMLEVCGIVTSIVTAVIVVLVEQYFEFSLFTLSFWVIIPAGALVTGAAAASGYYFGAKWSNTRPNRFHLANMSLIGLGTFFLIYWLQYLSFEVDGKSLSEYGMSFLTFLQISLTKAEYSLAHSSKGFEVGAFGYVLAALQLLGFLAGGAVLYFALLAAPFCSGCEKYLKKIFSMTKQFEAPEQAKPFVEKLHAAEPFSADYFALVQQQEAKIKIRDGATKIDWTLHQCPACREERVDEKLQIFRGRDWSEASGAARSMVVPNRQSVAAPFEHAQRIATAKTS